eukprot:scaffold4419_cov31-Tisochrysis_lutea.AAC.4
MLLPPPSAVPPRSARVHSRVGATSAKARTLNSPAGLSATWITLQALLVRLFPWRHQRVGHKTSFCCG